MLTNKQNKITKFYRTSHLLSSVFLQDYVIFINFLNIEMLQKFKELINKLGFVNIIYINNINKNYIYNNKILEKNKLFLKSQEWIMQGGLHAIICYDLKTIENIFTIFATTNLYKDKFLKFFKYNKNLSLIQHLNINLGFITHIKFQSYFFNFNTKFLNFFFILKNEYNVFKQTFFSRQIVTTTVWLFQSLILISFKTLMSVIIVFMFLIKQLLICFAYANKKSITS